MANDQDWFVSGEDEECPGVPCIDIHMPLEGGGSASVAYARAHMSLATGNFSITPAVEERARMIAAVPAMVRALQAVRNANTALKNGATMAQFMDQDEKAAALVLEALALIEEG